MSTDTLETRVANRISALAGMNLADPGELCTVTVEAVAGIVRDELRLALETAPTSTMTNEQFEAELSPEYREWTTGPSLDISGPVEEVQRLCEVIVGLRASLAEVEGARARSERDLGRLDQTQLCFREIEQRRTIAAKAAELERLRHIVEGLREVCGGEFVKHLEMRKFDRSPAQAEPQDESKIIGGHHENCDVFQPAPDGGPYQKPCNCRPYLGSERMPR